jgi:glycosyltransferase involved in cell wall biosynthesis
MNLLYILFSRGFGGLERYAIGKALAMANRGHDVYFIRRSGTEVAKRLKELNFPGEEWNPLKYIDLPAMLKIRSLIKRRGIEIVHAHHSADLGLISPALWKMSGIDLVYSNYMQVPKPKLDLYNRLEYGRIYRVVVGSESMRENSINNLPVPPEKIVTIPYGIDMKKFDPDKTPTGALREQYGIDKESPIIGIIGRLDPLKGQMEMIGAMSSILMKYPKAILALTGDETPEFKGKYKQLLEDKIEVLGLTSNIIFTGQTEDTASILADLDVYVLATHSETFSLGCLEAMAMRRPVVGTNSGGTPDMLDHGKCGLLAEPKSAESLAQKTMEFLSDRSLCDRLSEKAQDKVRNGYNNILSMDKLEDIYKGSRL